MKQRFARWSAVQLLMIAAAVFLITISRDDAPSAAPDYGKVGVHLLLDDGRQMWDDSLWDDHMAYAAQIVPPGGFVVQVVRADDVDAGKWQHFLDLCAQYGIVPVLRLATIFDYEKGYWEAPTADPDGRYTTLANNYANFLAALNWHTNNPYAILLNEPNNGVEWAGRPDPAAYARFFVDTARILKDRLPTVQILNAALDLYAPDTGSQPFDNGWYYINASRFMDEMVAAEPDVFTVIDVWNSHPYPMNGFRAPPWERRYQFDTLNDALPVTERPPSRVHNRGVNGYEWELWKLERFGIKDLLVMITETGWRHREGSPDSLDAGVDYPLAKDAAAYLDLAMRGNHGRYPHLRSVGWIPWLQDARVIGVVVFALNGTPEEWAHTNLLRLDTDGTVSGTYPAFDVLAGYEIISPP